MKDFDFDELDRAVSSALNSSPKPRRTASQPTKSQQAPVKTPVDEATSRDRPDLPLTVPERRTVKTDTPRTKTTTAVASRPRTGRFMDVVHPAAQVRRVAASEIAPEPVIAEEPRVEPVPQPPRAEVPMNDVVMVPRREVEVPAPQSVDTQEDSVEEPFGSVPESPFLPDAKVEKRPLGASVPTGVSVSDTLPQEVAPLSSLSADIDALLSSDEDGEVVVDTDHASLKGESSVTQPVVEPAEPVAEPAATEVSSEQDVAASFAGSSMTDVEAEAVPEFDEIASEQKPDQPKAPAPDTTEAVAYAGPVSITPQYTPKPSDSQQSGEIFDTESYHQPINAPAKKKRTGLIVALVVLLVVILGLGIGAVLYLYVLPML